MRAYLLREEFQRFWEYRSVYWAGRFLQEWCVARRCGFADQADEESGEDAAVSPGLLLNWFRARGRCRRAAWKADSAKLAMRKAYGFRTLRGVKIALYHRLGALPEPKFTHEFC